MITINHSLPIRMLSERISCNLRACSAFANRMKVKLIFFDHFQSLVGTFTKMNNSCSRND